MKILVVIPSYDRPYDIMKRAGRWIKNLKTDWKLFVEPQQLIYYRQNFEREQIVTTAKGIGVAGQMRFASIYAKENGYDYIFKADDDMCFKRSGTKIEQSAEVVESFFAECDKLMQEVGDIGAFTISKPIEYLHRQGETWKKRNKTLFGNYLAKVECCDLPEGLKLSDDMVIGVKVQQSCLPMYTYLQAHEDAIAWTNKGGCQSMDRFKATDEDMKILKNEFPLITQKITKGRADIDVSAYFPKNK